MDPKFKQRMTVVLPLLYSAYIASQCPCKTVPQCKLGQFLLGITLSLVASMSANKVAF